MKVYVGYDTREDIAYQVCEHSIKRRNGKADVVALKQSELREQGLYTREGTKMDGQVQLLYPRKNWSSMVLWNCGHPSNKKLTTELINKETGKYLHRFSWLDDSEIGSLPHEYNWLVGWYKEPKDGSPKILHYTEGGPWFENYRDCEYADVWKKELINLFSA